MSRLEIIELNGRRYVHAAECARYLGLTRARISQLCRNSTFTPFYVGSNCLIPLKQLESYADERACDNAKRR